MSLNFDTALQNLKYLLTILLVILRLTLEIMRRRLSQT